MLSPARMIIFGTVLTTLNKPMFAGSGAVYAAFGTVATLYWVTAGALTMAPTAEAHTFEALDFHPFESPCLSVEGRACD